MSEKGSGLDEEDEEQWSWLPEAALLQVFGHLDHRQLLLAGLACRRWNAVSCDDLLWRDLFRRDFQIDGTAYPSCRPRSWLAEYKRLCYHIPVAQSETLTEHRHQVLHVSFAHDGRLFATCSKDGYVLVWNSGYPASVRHQRDMKAHSWKYTQYSQFNESDTLLLVSGVHFGTPHSTSGEIAVFSLEDGFQLQCRVVNKPYDIFGTWYSDRLLLSGDLHWLAHLVSSSLLWLNKASQEAESEHVPITAQLYRFYNRNASSIRAVMVADCLSERGTELQARDPPDAEHGNPPSHPPQALDYARPFGYSCDYRDRFDGRSCSSSSSEGRSSVGSGSGSVPEPYQDAEPEPECEQRDKYLIFTTGSRAYIPHQIGFKRVRPVHFPERLDPGPSLKERLLLRQRAKEMRDQLPEPDWLDFDSVADRFDSVDHLIDLHGHIIGMALSPDHRYLYVNSRPWPSGCRIADPLQPPPIAQEIDIHVVDLVTLREVGRMLRAHKAYTPNNECFFIFLDVCREYVASGAEDRHGYLWDRHYGVCLAKFPHDNVVNAVAFNPRDPEMLVTASDDETVKVWRSRRRLRQLGLSAADLPMAQEVRLIRRRPSCQPAHQ